MMNRLKTLVYTSKEIWTAVVTKRLGLWRELGALNSLHRSDTGRYPESKTKGAFI